MLTISERPTAPPDASDETAAAEFVAKLKVIEAKSPRMKSGSMRAVSEAWHQLQVGR